MQSFRGTVPEPVEGSVSHHSVFCGSFFDGFTPVREPERHGGVQHHHPVSDPAATQQHRYILHQAAVHHPPAGYARLSGQPECGALCAFELHGSLCAGVFPERPVRAEGLLRLRHDFRVPGAPAAHAGGISGSDAVPAVLYAGAHRGAAPLCPAVCPVRPAGGGDHPGPDPPGGAAGGTGRGRRGVRGAQGAGGAGPAVPAAGLCPPQPLPPARWATAVLLPVCTAVSAPELPPGGRGLGAAPGWPRLREGAGYAGGAGAAAPERRFAGGTGSADRTAPDPAGRGRPASGAAAYLLPQLSPPPAPAAGGGRAPDPVAPGALAGGICQRPPAAESQQF